ncbi:MAG: AIR synthase-related protein, partial [Proteobacteria bacterium]|nr:AIR synthase-related protein [Pseudomonadota bacterium]
SVPRLPFALELIAEGFVPGGSEKNLSYVEPSTSFDASVAPEERLLLADAQTSGGLLLVVPPAREADLLAGLERAGTAAASVIGEIVEGEPGEIEVSAQGV